MQTSACELLPDTAWTRTLGCLGWKDSTGVGKLGTPQVGLGKHEMRDSERQRFGPQLPAWLCVCWKPWQDRMWAVREGGRRYGLLFTSRLFISQDLWIFPNVLMFQPEAARAILEYRIRTLRGALKNAQNLGYQVMSGAWIPPP